MTTSSLLSLILFLLLHACVPERCDKEIDLEAAVRIAREYFLSRSIAQLETGRPWERAEAERMRKAGMTEETYRETFQLTVPDWLTAPDRARRVGDQACGHPYIYYQARPSMEYGGSNISFVRIVPDDDLMRWRSTSTSINITKCGNFGRFFGTHANRMFHKRERLDYNEDLIGTTDDEVNARHAAIFRPCP